MAIRENNDKETKVVMENGLCVSKEEYLEWDRD